MFPWKKEVRYSKIMVTIQSQGNFHKIANHACMDEHIFENFFGEVTT